MIKLTGIERKVEVATRTAPPKLVKAFAPCVKAVTENVKSQSPLTPTTRGYWLRRALRTVRYSNLPNMEKRALEHMFRGLPTSFIAIALQQLRVK